jgi:hypothetical protein
MDKYNMKSHQGYQDMLKSAAASLRVSEDQPKPKKMTYAGAEATDAQIEEYFKVIKENQLKDRGEKTYTAKSGLKDPGRQNDKSDVLNNPFGTEESKTILKQAFGRFAPSREKDEFNPFSRDKTAQSILDNPLSGKEDSLGSEVHRTQKGKPDLESYLPDRERREILANPTPRGKPTPDIKMEYRSNDELIANFDTSVKALTNQEMARSSLDNVSALRHFSEKLEEASMDKGALSTQASVVRDAMLYGVDLPDNKLLASARVLNEATKLEGAREHSKIHAKASEWTEGKEMSPSNPAIKASNAEAAKLFQDLKKQPDLDRKNKITLAATRGFEDLPSNKQMHVAGQAIQHLSQQKMPLTDEQRVVVGAIKKTHQSVAQMQKTAAKNQQIV